ncbi:MAG TPA: ABC transporter permease [Rhizomicrobium sp.]|nr:ABC transporter permease [Rhizomicrobium sp.]
MLRNYLVTAFRNLIRHKLYSFINIAGLAVGLACTIFILLFLRDEFSYDAWIADSQNVYRVESTFHMPGRDPDFFSLTPFPVTPTMLQEIPEVVAQIHIVPENTTAQVGDREFPVTVNAVDPNFFQVIKLPFVKGDPVGALKDPQSIVLSQMTARKFFGAGKAIGRTVILNGSQPLVVTGIFRELPHNTHLSLEMVIPNTSKADTMALATRSQWVNNPGWGYVKLAPNADPDAVRAKLPAMLDRHIDAKKLLNMNIAGSSLLHLHLTPFRRVHLDAFGETEKGRWATIYGFAAIAGLILLIATINYVNLATARAMVRAREVGLRKVLGARRSQLIVQFMGESLLLALSGLVLAFALVEILLPSFDSLLARPIDYRFVSEWPLTLAILAAVILAGLSGGIYPALVLSRFRPATVLGAGGRAASGSAVVRSALVVLQFAISIGLGVAVIVIFAQIRYSRQLDLGFDRHNLMVIDGGKIPTASARDSLAEALAADPAIAGVAQSGMVPFEGKVGIADVNLPGAIGKITVRAMNIDPNFITVYGMRLMAGRDLSRSRGEDVMHMPASPGAITSANALINAQAARRFGYSVTGAIGHSLIFNSTTRLTVVGVVGDANFDGVQSAMQPFVYVYGPEGLGVISVRIKPGQAQAATAAIDKAWHRFMPTIAIRRRFEDANFDRLFSSDEQVGRIFAIFVGIAIFIACMGLFGLASFATERRAREIGIRKVFGARVRDILKLLLWQFSIPVLIANAIAWPVAWYYLHGWLEGFAYRITLGPLYFVAAGAAALAIAWATIFVHAWRVANANPVYALRYE